MAATATKQTSTESGGDGQTSTQERVDVGSSSGKSTQTQSTQGSQNGSGSRSTSGSSSNKQTSSGKSTKTDENTQTAKSTQTATDTQTTTSGPRVNRTVQAGTDQVTREDIGMTIGFKIKISGI